MMLKRSVVTLAAMTACWFPGTAMAATSVAPVPAVSVPAGLLPMATSWQSPLSGIVLGYPSRGTGAKPYLLVTANGGRTWRSLPAPPVTYPADNDQPDAIWTGGVIAVTDGTHIVVTRDNGRNWSAERVPGGFYVAKLVITSGRLFALLTSDTGTAVYSGPVGGALRAVRGLSVSGSLTYGDITGVGTLQVDLGSDYSTQRYWYSRDGVHFVSARLPCPATTSALLGGVRDGHVIALCSADPSDVGPGETDVQVWTATRLGGAFRASGPVSDSPNILGFAAASARDLAVATIFDLQVTRNAGQTWTAELVQNNGAIWSDLSFSTATTGTVVCSTVDNEGNEVSTVYRTTNAGRTWGAVKLP
jgi:hypothetical protein